MELKENKTKKWTGTYKGVDFEINNWQIPPNSIEPKEKDLDAVTSFGGEM